MATLCVIPASVKDDIPPGEQPEAVDHEVSLAGRILVMREEHRDLDRAIKALYQQPYRDQLQLQRLKKKKLQLKDAIARLEHELIPDLDA
ncbi:MAG: DUF465 domain-containing protein [Halieaceae bacterium]|nr:DUF465 domain-containing protein [Halieaceae bacterium]